MPKDRSKEMAAFGRILDIMDELREKCPWDREQTTQSLRPLTIEETYELSDAILHEDPYNVSKELGDILLHIIFYAKIGEEQGTFNMTDVIDKLCDKLIYRHPHVFSTTQVENAGQVVQNWEQLKTKEKDGNKTILSGVPESLPSVIKAYRMQDKARAVGFDWTHKEQVWGKVEEEMMELKAELSNLAKAPEEEQAHCLALAEKEYGDVLFSLINAGRLYGLNPDSALEATCGKFRSRFTYLEQRTIKQGGSLKEMTLEQMDELWNEAKALEKKENTNQ